MLVQRVLLPVSVVMMFSACSTMQDRIKEDLEPKECTIAGVKAPFWACGNYNESDRYLAVGSAPISKLGYDFTRKDALTNARANLVNEIEVEVKAKTESYMRSTGISDTESIERVVSIVSRQTSSMVLNDSTQINSWENPNDKFLYLLVATPKSSVNRVVDEEIKKALSSLDSL